MNENIKEIVSRYLKIPVEQINETTEIGRNALVNSILVHRMYAAIAKEGFEINNYQEIKTYGALLNKISGEMQTENLVAVSIDKNDHLQTGNQNSGIGIDIEEISNLPRTEDFREDEFYKMNFTSQEMAYSIIQPDPYGTFCGLFAAKEAIVKADNHFKSIPFNKLFVHHLEDGKPVFDGFQISISHTKDMAIGVAIKEMKKETTSPVNVAVPVYSKRNPGSSFLIILAFILALVAIVISIWR